MISEPSSTEGLLSDYHMGIPSMVRLPGDYFVEYAKYCIFNEDRTHAYKRVNKKNKVPILASSLKLTALQLFLDLRFSNNLTLLLSPD